MSIQTPIKPSVPAKSLDFGAVKSYLSEHMVTAMFLVVSLIGLMLSRLPLNFVLADLIGRLARNSLLVLALLIPVMAGMGLNFAIVLGAMSAQLAVIAVFHWNIGGIAGFMLAFVLCTPVAILVGIATGTLLNKTRGQEMITSMITGYFANGVYMLILLVLMGTLIPINNPDLMLGGGVGVKNTVDLGLIRYAVDGLFERTFGFTLTVPLAGVILGAISALYLAWSLSKKKLVGSQATTVAALVGAVAVAALSAIAMLGDSLFNFVKIPLPTFMIIALACLFINFISKTKLGQDFKAVGQDQHVARVSGINVEKTRIIAITISTVMAAWGQLLLLQNFGNLSTYDSHSSVGTFAIAALLIGGASVTKATVGQALIGLVLFHTLFLVSPIAGKNLLGDAQLGEFFRSFVAFGIIATSLVMHAWKRALAGKKKLHG